jgi:chalcone isomerase-like protein
LLKGKVSEIIFYQAKKVLEKRRLIMRRLIPLFLMLFVASPVFAGTLAGVTMPDTAQVNGKSLVLNGMGVRKKLFIKVYVAGLYLPAKETSSDKILAGDTERRMVMDFLMEVEKRKICNAWQDGLQNNSPDKAAALKGSFDTLCTYMEDMEGGHNMSITYVPGQGTSVSVNGKVKGTIPGKDFADAMFACWIGYRPPNPDLKTGLLGG